MHRSLTLIVCLVVGACGASPAAPTSAPGSDAAQRAEDLEGSYRLVFELERGTWKAGEPIDGLATLALLDQEAVDVGGSGSGLFGFGFEEVGGRRRLGPASTADCVTYRLDRATPRTSNIKKAVGFSADEPDADFYRTFISDPLLRLPVGDWRITAVAQFIEGVSCGGASRSLIAPILVHVTR
jgi:hypothetical protein